MINNNVSILVATIAMITVFFLQPKDLELNGEKLSVSKTNKPSYLSKQNPLVASIGLSTNGYQKKFSWFDQDEVMLSELGQDHTEDLEANAIEDHGDGDTIEENIDEIEEDEIEPSFPPSMVGDLLTEHIVLTEGLGPNAENDYQKSLDQLRVNAEEAVILLADAYSKIEEDQYLDRWKMVDTLATIKTEKSLDILSTIAKAVVPEEKFPGEHGFSSKSEELMIRRAAIYGIENLVKEGYSEAEKVLLSLTKSEETNVREGAILAYIRTDSNQEVKKTELRETLPEKDHWILDLKELSDTQSAGPVSFKDELVKTDLANGIDTAEPAKEHSLPPAGITP